MHKFARNQKQNNAWHCIINASQGSGFRQEIENNPHFWMAKQEPVSFLFSPRYQRGAGTENVKGFESTPESS